MASNIIDNDAKVIAGDDYGFGHPSICRLSTTIMLTTHINESNELEIHKSTNDGVNWTLKKTLANASGCFNLIPMTSTKAGLVYQKNSNEFEVWVTTDAGENWTNKLDITVGIDSNDKATLLYNSNLGRLYVISHMVGDTYPTGIKYSDNDGDSWSSKVGSTAKDIIDGDISLIDNKIYCYSIVNIYIYEEEWDSDGSNYASTQIYTGTPHSVNVVVDSQGNRWVCYITDKLYIRKNKIDETELFADAIIKGSISIGVDEDDNVYVYYTKTSDEKTYYRKYDALTTTWETEVELIGVANNRINTEKHVLGGSDKLHFVYYKAP